MNDVVHPIIQLRTVQRFGATEPSQLSIDVIEQVPELPEHGAQQPVPGSSQAESKRRGESRAPCRQRHSVRRNPPRCDDPGYAKRQRPRDARAIQEPIVRCPSF